MVIAPGDRSAEASDGRAGGPGGPICEGSLTRSGGHADTEIMDSTNVPRPYSTKLPIVIGAITTLSWVCVPVLAIILPMLVAPEAMTMAMDEAWAESSGAARSTGRRHPGAVAPAVAGDPAVLAARLRAAGFEDDPNLDARRRTRSFGAWIAALRYDDETSGCTVLLEGTNSTTVELVEIEATFNERVGAGEIVRVLGPVLSILDPGASPPMIVAAIHDGSGTVGPWYAERGPREGGGMAVMLFNGQTPTALAE